MPLLHTSFMADVLGGSCRGLPPQPWWMFWLSEPWRRWAELKWQRWAAQPF
ncbi:hypothetical protein HTS61_06385 [Escherichia coli]|nr:hypothetical protein [Escherichia coli]